MQNPTSPTRIFHDVTVSQPEKSLMLALLESAVSDFQMYATASTVRIFHFESICDGLCLDPSFLRRGLHRWRAVRCGHTGARALAHE
jgi:hypothetical protein